MKRNTAMLLAIAFAAATLHGCVAMNGGDPTRPEIRKKHQKFQQEDLRSRFGRD